MNTHQNALLTYLRRLEMVQDMSERGLTAAQAGANHGVSAVTARKWLGRYLADGASALMDKSSRPARSPRSIAPSVALTIVELRRKMLLQARIASYMSVSKATVSRVLRRAGLSRLSDLQPDDPVQRYERDAPSELLHIDTKKLGRFTRSGIASLATGPSAHDRSWVASDSSPSRDATDWITTSTFPLGIPYA